MTMMFPFLLLMLALLACARVHCAGRIPACQYVESNHPRRFQGKFPKK